MQKSLIVSLLTALLLVIFALQNTILVPIDFIIGKPIEGKLSLILLVTLIIGICIGLLLSFPTFKKYKKNITKNNSEIIKLKNILDEYKKEYGINKYKTPEDKPFID